MMSARMPVFHIGANKAGSTTLQRALFARHSQVLNLCKPTPVPAASNAISAILKSCDSRVEDAASPDVGPLQRHWREAVTAAADNTVAPVYSYEKLIRYYYYGSSDPCRLPKKIMEITGPFRVIIVIRHQVRLVESLYVHKSNSTSFLPPNKWFARDPEWLAFGYKFHEIAEAWAHVVGVENVGVFLFEELANDPASFAHRICNFIGIDPDEGSRLLANRHENLRTSARTYAYARLRSSFFPNLSLGNLLPGQVRRKWRDYLEGGRRSHVELPADWLARMEAVYRADNRKLADRFGLPLKDYNYPM